MNKIIASIAIIALVSGCTQRLTPEERYQRYIENQPKSWAGLGINPNKARDFHMWRKRKRCETVYSMECLELDIWGDRSVRENRPVLRNIPPQPHPDGTPPPNRPVSQYPQAHPDGTPPPQ